MATNYWQRFIDQRLSRRRALAGTGAGALAAALLAACGSDDKSSASGSNKDKSGLLSQAVDQAKDVKRGGQFKRVVSDEWQPFDPILSVAIPLNRVYSRLFRVKGGHLEPTAGEVEGDLAESWEFSPDNLTLTVKLTQKAHFAPQPPVNGRVPDARDVLFSWERLKAVGLNRGQLVNEINPAAPVKSITSPDDRTVVIQLIEPMGTALNLFGPLPVEPREAEDQGKLDLRNTMLGSGPWMIGEYVPSSRFVYKRNPGFGQDARGLPYIDEIYSPVMPEYATQLAALKAGSIYMSFSVRPEDILQTKKDVPALEMLASPLATNPRRIIFGQLPAGETPFRDERVRQAFSMAQDRDAFIDVFYNVDKFRNEGLPMTTAWSSSVMNADSWNGYWLDPQGKDFGPNAKYFLHDIAEAKKLLAAAGYANGFEFKSIVPLSGHPYGPDYPKTMEIINGMISEAGFKPKNTDINFAGDFRGTVQNGGGKFEGVSIINSFSVPDPVDFVFRTYNSGSMFYYGWDPDGKGTFKGDPFTDDISVKIRREFDVKKRIALAYEIQKYDAKKQYYPATGGGANGFTLAWPCVRGRFVWQGDGYRDDATLWLDQSKPPFKV